MKPFFIPSLSSFALLACLLPLHAVASEPVSVGVVDPDKFTDAGTGIDRQRNLATLEKYLKTEGAQCLREGEKVDLQVFNVDLAGTNEWWHRNGQDLRVMRDVTWPRIELSFVRRDAQGQVLSEGREWISDVNYFLHAATIRRDRDPLAYEKVMLHDWFNKKWCDGRAQQAAK